MYGAAYEANRLANLRALGKELDPASYPDYGYSDFAKGISLPVSLIPGVGLYASAALNVSSEYVSYKVGNSSGNRTLAIGTANTANVLFGTVANYGTQAAPLPIRIGVKAFFGLPTTLLNFTSKKVK